MRTVMERRAREKGGTWSTLPGTLQRRCVCLCACVYVCVCSIFPLSLQLATGARDTDINPDKEKTDEVFSSPSRPERISFRPMRFVGLCVLRVGRRGCGVLLLNTSRWWTTGWTGRPAH